jgi:hypothetical protein
MVLNIALAIISHHFLSTGRVNEAKLGANGGERLLCAAAAGANPSGLRPEVLSPRPEKVRAVEDISGS